MTFKVVKADDQDLALMQRLFYQTVTTYGNAIFTKEEIKVYSKLATEKKYWLDKFEKGLIFNAKLNGEIIGSICMDAQGFIEYIFVHKNYQGKGVAQELYDCLEKDVVSRSFSKLVTKVNPITKNFYQKNGFTIYQEVKKVSGGEDKVVEFAQKNLK